MGIIIWISFYRTVKFNLYHRVQDRIHFHIFFVTFLKLWMFNFKILNLTGFGNYVNKCYLLFIPKTGNFFYILNLYKKWIFGEWKQWKFWLSFEQHFFSENWFSHITVITNSVPASLCNKNGFEVCSNSIGDTSLWFYLN